ncbi:MAG: hypothetical protein P4L49_09855 [Desulfosporosinus sp.]|nr:hypothetical protein [Desulfosporosinus sp.]
MNKFQEIRATKLSGDFLSLESFLYNHKEEGKRYDFYEGHAGGGNKRKDTRSLHNLSVLVRYVWLLELSDENYYNLINSLR